MAASDPRLRASLYVGDLHPEVTEKDLVETFREVGQLVSVHLCRDKFSRKSLCYAYVNFYYPNDALAALNRLNFTELRGKPMRIMWCQRDPISRKTSIGNLFVKNLDPSITSAQLQEIFSKHGTIISCKVAEENGRSKGYGFVQFDSEDSAMAALNAFNGIMLDGKKLSVFKFVKKSERKNAETAFTNLYVKNLDESITEDLLKNKFSEFGKVSSAVIMKDELGKSKGFGFVNFNSHEEAKKAMEALNGQLIGSKNLFVGRAQKKAEREEILRHMHGDKCTNCCKEFSKDSNLYVKNLDVSIDDRKLKELFSSHGNITSAKVIRHGDETSKGFGFVCFSCPDEAKKALHSLNGTSVEGRTLHVALAHQREQQSREFQKSSASFTPQPLYSSNWNFLAHKSRPPSSNFPNFYSSIPIQKLSLWNPGLYQNFDRPSDSFYPLGAMNFPEIFSTYPVQFTPCNGSKQDQDVKTRTHQIPSRRSQYKINNGDEEKSSKGGSVKPFIMRSSPEVHKKRPGHIHPNFSARSSFEMHEKSPGYINCPLVQNFQPGLRLEMTKSDTQKLLNSPKSLAMQVMKAVQVQQGIK